ncbi:hypothetical protein FNZ07_27510 [Paraburkholderia megapolitana]|nr:hypothetical protein FNZ07_27510 [Paraburkholderia megapolitana]
MSITPPREKSSKIQVRAFYQVCPSKKAARRVPVKASARCSHKRIKARIVTESGYDMYIPPFTCNVVPVM